MMRVSTLALIALSFPAIALACEPPPPPKGDFKLLPSVTCKAGHRSEWIYVSRANGDEIDGVFAFCRDPSLSSEAWIQRVESTREKLIAGTQGEAGKEAIRRAFAAHIARERSAH